MEDVRIFLNGIPSNVPVIIMIQNEDGKTHYSSEAKGEFRDSVIVVPGKRYVVTVTNVGTESVNFENFEFNNARFVEGNYWNAATLSITGFYILIIGFAIMIGGFVIARIRGERIAWS